MNSQIQDALTPQSILLVVLIGVAVWAVVELALLLRKTRGTVDELTEGVNETLNQVQPIITKLDGVIDTLQPTLNEVEPMVEKVELALDEANVSLAKINGILGDVSEMSEAANSVTSSVKDATSAAVNTVAGLVDRVAGGSRGKRAAIEASAKSEAVPALDVASEVDEPRHGGYITYGANAVLTDEQE